MPAAPRADPGPQASGGRRGLFTRIFVAYVLTGLVFAVATGVLGFQLARSYGPSWYGPILEQIDEQAAEISAHIDDPRRLQQLLRPLERETDTRIRVEKRPAGPGAMRKLPVVLSRAEIQQLRHDQPVVHPRGGRAPPLVIWRLRNPDSDKIVGIVIVEPKHLRGRFAVWAGLMGLLILGGGSWVVASGLTSRLARLQATAGALASGDLGARAEVRGGSSTDEIDDLGLAFNRMADEVERLLQGQRVLLANVSHELRTPVARVKVLLEILEGKVERLRRSAGEAPDPALDRLERGLSEMADDIREMETLIADLLTSGRLELGKEGGALDRRATALRVLLERSADRFGADVRCPPDLEFGLDELLIERLLRNLLSNARRACPEGVITVTARATDEGGLELVVEDEGPGVPPEHRDAIFEPFHRLDTARNRDAGGVGLGLHLCRQIARAHGGGITVLDRPDGASGARFEVRLEPE